MRFTHIFCIAALFVALTMVFPALSCAAADGQRDENGFIMGGYGDKEYLAGKKAGAGKKSGGYKMGGKGDKKYDAEAKPAKREMTPAAAEKRVAGVEKKKKEILRAGQVDKDGYVLGGYGDGERGIFRR